jgi:hypothetical protein
MSPHVPNRLSPAIAIMPKPSLVLASGLAVAVALAAIPAHAQVQVPPPQKHSCEHPGDHPGRLASDQARRGWNKAATAFLECLKKFVRDQEAAARPYNDAAKVHIDAGNAAVVEYNESAKSFTEQQDKATK